MAGITDAPAARAGLAVHVARHVVDYEERDYEVPYFAVGDLQVWGATAMVLSEFLALFDVTPARPGATRKATAPAR